MQTEQPNPRTYHLHDFSTTEILKVMNDEDATVPALIREAIPEIARAVDRIVACLKQGGRLIYVGAGTSGRLAMLDAVECVPTFGIDPEQVQALLAGGMEAMYRVQENAEDDDGAARNAILALGVCENDAVVGIAASGKTPYVIGALKAARACGAATIAVSCNRPAPLLDIADISIAVVTGPEVISGSTRLKAGTAQKLILNMLSSSVMIQLGKVYQNYMVDLLVTNQKLALRARRMVAELVGTQENHAEELLQAAHGNIKVAILCGKQGLSPDEALHQLDAAEGYLQRILVDSNK
jgi:N-acetylmuramic acid 6-phosphate etherase